MITDINQLDLSKTYTYADYLQWKFEERVELFKGFIHKMSPAPSRRHQRISIRLGSELDFFYKKESCEVFAAPFDVRLPKLNEQGENISTVVQPDICVVCDLEKLDKRGCNGAPDLVIEILSPGNTKKEMKNKYELYEEAGVQEYWLVHPQDNNVLVFVLGENEKYQIHKIYTEDDTLESPTLKGFQLDLTEIF